MAATPKDWVKPFLLLANSDGVRAFYREMPSEQLVWLRSQLPNASVDEFEQPDRQRVVEFRTSS